MELRSQKTYEQIADLSSVNTIQFSLSLFPEQLTEVSTKCFRQQFLSLCH